MKNTLFSVVVLILLASCKTSNDVVSNSIFQKRKYTKGYYINSSKKYRKNNKTNQRNIIKDKVFIEEEIQNKEAISIITSNTSENQTDNLADIKSDLNISKPTLVNNERAALITHSEKQLNTRLTNDQIKKENNISKNFEEKEYNRGASGTSVFAFVFSIIGIITFSITGFGVIFGGAPWIMLLTFLFFLPSLGLGLLSLKATARENFKYDTKHTKFFGRTAVKISLVFITLALLIVVLA